MIALHCIASILKLAQNVIHELLGTQLTWIDLDWVFTIYSESDFGLVLSGVCTICACVLALALGRNMLCMHMHDMIIPKMMTRASYDMI